MRRCFQILIVLSLSLLLFGCAIFQTGSPSDMEDDEDDEAALPSPVPTQPVSPVTPTANPAELYEAARTLYIQGIEQAQAGNFDEAHKINSKVLRMLMQPFDRKADERVTKKIDSLYFEVCLAEVRVGRLTQRWQPVVIEKKLIGIDFHPSVEKWLGYFTISGRESMQRYISRSSRYLPMIRKVLKEEGLPEDLAYLPIIESGYSPYAYSPAAAAGMWQFIRTTGQTYGLKIDEWVDERRDPEKSTRAAARFLKYLYGNFGDWALALAAYNCGEGCVSGAISREGHRDYWRLNLPSETMEYVPKYFAAVLVARDPELYGMYVVPDAALDIGQIELQGVVELKKFAEVTGVSYEEIKALNPEIIGSYTPPNTPNYKLNVPAEKREEIAQIVAKLTPAELYLEQKQVTNLKKPQSRSASGGFIWYKVKSGDTLGKIAKRYRTTVKMIQRYNPGVRAQYLRPGQKLKIPVGRKR